jgi:hypothetical protein
MVTLHAQGERAAADAAFERALAIHERVVGLEHADTGRVLERRALGLWKEGDVAGVRAPLERAVAIYERALPNHPWLQESRRALEDIRRNGVRPGVLANTDE